MSVSESLSYSHSNGTTTTPRAIRPSNYMIRSAHRNWSRRPKENADRISRRGGSSRSRFLERLGSSDVHMRMKADVGKAEWAWADLFFVFFCDVGVARSVCMVVAVQVTYHGVVVVGFFFKKKILFLLFPPLIILRRSKMMWLESTMYIHSSCLVAWCLVTAA